MFPFSFQVAEGDIYAADALLCCLSIPSVQFKKSQQLQIVKMPLKNPTNLATA